MKNKELDKAYDFAKNEERIYKKWEDSGYFNPDNLDLPESAENYTIILPPPNITDKLHVGHSSMLAIQDMLIRFHRMNGYRTLWLPGTDHAAIATQNVVEKRIYKESGKTRHDLGKEKFLDEVWKFLRTTQSTILDQTRRMGSSLDWSREAFTLDDDRKKAVEKIFIDMYNEGVIYRGERIVNWCPRCLSTLADDEVEHREQATSLYTFKYDENFPIPISTTRPETKLGDTAVAVNPKDERYKDFLGKTFEADFLGIKLNLKISGDWHVEQNFGTGALGVTPAHSAIDWKMAEDHNLEIIKVIDENGIIKDGFDKFSGKNVLEVRKEIVKELKNKGLLIKEEEIQNNLSVCYRCDTPIEPIPSKQWFLSVDKKLSRLNGKSLKERCIEVAENESIEFMPSRFKKRYLDWMNELHDWCISRQIWFGHGIPAWHKTSSKLNVESEKFVEVMFLRHGKTEWNIKSIMQGTTDTELTEIGIEQAKSKIDVVAKFKPDLIISSPLKRAMHTAEIVADGKFEIIQDKRIQERYYADVQGMSFKEIQEIYPNFESFTVNDLPYLVEVPEGGELYEDVLKRTEEFLWEIADKYKGKKIVVMSHGDPLDMVDAILDNKTWREGVGGWHNNTRVRIDKIYLEDKKLKVVKDEEIVVSKDKPEGEDWIADEDSLDTWFSSGMWTFSTLGWPDKYINGVKSGDLAKFHPTQVLETGYELITLWVSRMILMSIFALDEIPFEKVYLHGMVCDDKGKKMSKSKGNGIDPLDMIKKFGTDAVRLSLLIGSTPGNDVRFSEEKTEGFRNMVNKLWNVSRYIISSVEELKTNDKLNAEFFNSSDLWIVGKMRLLIDEVTAEIKKYNFSLAGEKLRDFTWNDLADWYLEASKFDISQEKDKILLHILKDLLKMWHPFIPFVTEKIWEEMNEDKLLMIEAWPDINEYPVIEKFEDFETVKDIIIAVRNARSENKIEPSKKVKAIIYANKKIDLLNSQSILIKSLRTGIEEISILETGEKIEDAIYISVKGVDIYLIGGIDKTKELDRLQKEIDNLEKIIKVFSGKLSNKDFVNKAPADIVEKEKNKLESYKINLNNLNEQLKRLN